MKYLDDSEYSLSIDNYRVVKVKFRDGKEFSFPTSINSDQVDGDNWHKHGVTGHIPTVNSTVTRFIWSPPEVYSKLKFELQDCWMALRDYPAIEYLNNGRKFSDEFGDPVSTGDTTEVDIFGPVRHIIDTSKMILVNATLPTHWLHEGYVVRHVIDEGGGIFSIDSVGFGVGRMPTINDLGAPVVWARASVSSISKFASEYYADRTGNYSIYYVGENEFNQIPTIHPSSIRMPVF